MAPQAAQDALACIRMAGVDNVSIWRAQTPVVWLSRLRHAGRSSGLPAFESNCFPTPAQEAKPVHRGRPAGHLGAQADQDLGGIAPETGQAIFLYSFDTF